VRVRPVKRELAREGDRRNATAAACAKWDPPESAEASASELVFDWDDATMARVYTRKAGAEEADRERRIEARLTKKIVPPPAPPEGNDNQNDASDEGGGQQGAAECAQFFKSLAMGMGAL
jgi:hypothetical protein